MSVSLCLLTLTWTGSLPELSPCLLPAVWLALTLEKDEAGKENHLCTIRSDLHHKGFFFQLVLITICNSATWSLLQAAALQARFDHEMS